MSTFLHDPAEVQDYGVDWGAKWLQEGETITGHTVTVAGATLVTSGVVGSQTVARVTGGTLRQRARITHHVVASSGREANLTQSLMIVEK